PVPGKSLSSFLRMRIIFYALVFGADRGLKKKSATAQKILSPAVPSRRPDVIEPAAGLLYPRGEPWPCSPCLQRAFEENPPVKRVRRLTLDHSVPGLPNTCHRLEATPAFNDARTAFAADLLAQLESPPHRGEVPGAACGGRGEAVAVHTIPSAARKEE